MFNGHIYSTIEQDVARIYSDCRRHAASDTAAARVAFTHLSHEHTKEYIYKYLAHCGKRDTGACLFSATSRFPIETLEIATDSEIYEAIKNDFWRVMIHPAALRNLFGLTVYGPADTLSKAVRDYHDKLSLDANYVSPMALYPTLRDGEERVQDIYLSVASGFVQGGAAASTFGSTGGEVMMLLSSMSQFEKRRNNYQAFGKMLQAAYDYRSLDPVKIARAETMVENAKRVHWVMLQKLRQNYIRYEDEPALLTNSIAAINMTLQNFAIGGKTEALTYSGVLEEFFDGEKLAKADAMRLLTIGGFFTGTRSEATDVAAMRRAPLKGTQPAPEPVEDEDEDTEAEPMKSRLLGFFSS